MEKLMAWTVLFALVALAGVIGIVVNFNRLRFEQRTALEMAALTGALRCDLPRPDICDLPPPVARYRGLAVGERPPAQTLRMRHRGTFCMSPTAKAAPIRGTQLFTSDPPGFVWSGRVRMAPGVWIDVRDMSISGEGSMRVLLDDTVALADASGPQIDQGAALRLLAEMVWYPTSLFDRRYVTWTAIDADHARATLRVGGREVSGVFEFGPEGLPLRMSAERFIDKGTLRPWAGVYRDWRTIEGMRVPFEAEVTWQLESGPFTYAHWLVESMEYDGESSPAATSIESAQAKHVLQAHGMHVAERS
jgi:hypothetical protein